MRMVDFYGSVTVGERGQIALPSKLRRELGIQAGDKILVMCGPEKKIIHLIKADMLAEMFDEWETLRKRIREKE